MDSEEIAAGDLGVDTNPATDALKNARKGNWQVVLENHFPIEPGEVKVRRNTPTSRMRAESAKDLRNLGMGLHYFQDSYGHEGAYVGNIRDQARKYGAKEQALFSALNSSDAAIGHPDDPEIGSRFSNTATDDTSKSPYRAAACAQETFELLIGYRKRTGRIHAADEGRLRAKWDRLDPIVLEFVRAGSKEEKIRWAKKYMPLIEIPFWVLKAF